MALSVALLLGLAALWLSNRALRADRTRLTGSSSVAPEPKRSSRPSPQELAALVGQDGFWICLTCHSVNRREANRCYSCRAAKGSAGPPAPAALPVSRRVPVMAKGKARSVDHPVATTVVPAATGTAHPASAVLVRDPEPASPEAPRQAASGVSVCPFLGFRDDPSTRCDFPDSRNHCHATSKRGATLFASPRQFVTGKAGRVRSQPIDAEHQKSTCLSATYEQCARYPAVLAGAAPR
jgi:hypothetical protein